MVAVVGVDVGGTFTDFVAFDGLSVTGRKLPTSSPQNHAVVEGLEGGELLQPGFLHGTTVATNQLLEGTGPRVTLVTSPGFEDVLEIGRQARPSLYDPFDDRPVPLVARDRRLTIDDVHAGLLPDLLEDTDAVAVALIRSYDDPTDELALAADLRSTFAVPVSVASEVSPAFREYERIATTVLNAFLTPTVASYLQALDEAVDAEPKMIMTSSGGVIPFDAGSRLAGRLVLSGPAAGVVAATSLAEAKGYNTAISFDMGGTSTDVSRIGGEAAALGSHMIGGRVNRVPSTPIHTIGAGGGSVAWIDPGGALRVGPKSAGSIPGPASYGRGGIDPTVTDANIMLGAIPSSLALGGEVVLDVAAGMASMERPGKLLGFSAAELAGGILDVVDSHMERALRAVSVEEGHDPRNSVLVAFGGAGGLHATRLAKSLGMARVIVPPLAGVFSALGLLLASPRVDVARTVLLEEGSGALGDAIGAIQADALAVFDRDFSRSPTDVAVVGEARYVGQSHELRMIVGHEWAELRRSFEEAHRTRFGFDRPDQPIELVNLHAEASGTPHLRWIDLPDVEVASAPESGSTPMVVEGVSRPVDVWERQLLPAGFECEGPCLVIEKDSVTRLERGDLLSVHDDGTLEVTM